MPERIEAVTRTLAVASGKGGVGKTTVTVNLALALAQGGARIRVQSDVLPDECEAQVGVNVIAQPWNGGAREVERPSVIRAHDLHDIRLLRDPGTGVRRARGEGKPAAAHQSGRADDGIRAHERLVALDVHDDLERPAVGSFRDLRNAIGA